MSSHYHNLSDSVSVSVSVLHRDLHSLVFAEEEQRRE